MVLDFEEGEKHESRKHEVENDDLTAPGDTCFET